jgi:hypothetical protein
MVLQCSAKSGSISWLSKYWMTLAWPDVGSKRRFRVEKELEFCQESWVLICCLKAMQLSARCLLSLSPKCFHLWNEINYISLITCKFRI